VRDLALLPKAHLHVHLESAVRPSTLADLTAAAGVEPPAAVSGLSALFDGFRGFADHNAVVRGCLRRPEDFTRIAVEFCEDEAAQGTRYAEVTFTAASHGERLGRPDMPLEAVLHGLELGRSRHGIECRVIIDHPRRRSVERARQTLRLAVEHGPAVAAIGLAGEEGHPVAPFREVFDDARAAGVHVVHHAGEMCGPASIRDAVDDGRAERLGHGIRVLDDADLVAEVRDRGIALEVCPSSNVALGLVRSIAAHPLPLLRAAGLIVTVNTDIPSVTGTSLTAEYATVRDAFGYDDATLASLAAAAVDVSFAPLSTKARLHAGITAWLAAPD